jgi:hypothetical protein
MDSEAIQDFEDWFQENHTERTKIPGEPGEEREIENFGYKYIIKANKNDFVLRPVDFSKIKQKEVQYNDSKKFEKNGSEKDGTTREVEKIIQLLLSKLLAMIHHQISKL